VLIIEKNRIKLHIEEKQMGVLDFFSRKKKTEFNLEEELASGKSALEILQRVNSGMREGAVSKDVLSKGYGPYGLCPTNPIPTQGMAESRIYLSRLRARNRRPIQAVRNGCTAVENVTNGLIDIYTIMCDGHNLGNVYLCPYHKKTSSIAPEGFELV
jgi:hypothetical protein